MVVKNKKKVYENAFKILKFYANINIIEFVSGVKSWVIVMEVRAQVYTKFKPIKATCHDLIVLQLIEYTYSNTYLYLARNLLHFFKGRRDHREDLI